MRKSVSSFNYQFKSTRQKEKGKSIVYLDESGFSQDNHRPNGYALIGQRCYAKYAWGRKKRTNAIGAILDFKMITTCLFDCSIDANVFL